MKLTTLVLGLALSVSSFATTVIPGNATGIKLAFANVTKIPTEFRTIPCSMSDSDLDNCKWPTAYKSVVQVTVDYSSTAMSESEESIVKNFDASLFTAEELKALKSRNASVRMNAARNLFDVSVKSEVRTVSHEVCQSDWAIDCRNGYNSYTDTYDTTVKVVTISKK